ncbi:hypothetical protein [Pseudonocardia sp. T1-2H]|uniref:hypothetical protein n=1 Tax=Pseudonocardia sp. T1-2H TaxID=3128899 RepID=UPI003101894F
MEVPRCVIRIGLPRGKRDAEMVERVSCVARGVSEEHPTEPTVRSRMLAAPISLERLEEHFRAGRVLLDGEPVESLEVLAPPGTRIHFGSA